MKVTNIGSSIVWGDGRTYYRINTDQFDGIWSCERTVFIDLSLFCYFILVEDIFFKYTLNFIIPCILKTSLKPLLKLVSIILYFCTKRQPFKSTSSKKLCSFLRYLNFHNIFSSTLPHIVDTKWQLKLE